MFGLSSAQNIMDFLQEVLLTVMVFSGFVKVMLAVTIALILLSLF